MKTVIQTKRRTKEQKEADLVMFMEQLRATPREKLSKVAIWWLDNQDKVVNKNYDMRAVLK